MWGASACTATVRSDGGPATSATSVVSSAASSPTSGTSTTTSTTATTTTSLSAVPTPTTRSTPVPSTETVDTSLAARACGESHVYVIGDSLTKGADFPGGLGKLLAYAGYHAQVDAEISRFIKAGVQILDLHAHRRHDNLEPVVMVALGTNDAHAGFTANAEAALIDELMTAVGPHRLVVWTTTQFLPSFRSDQFNRVLRLKAAYYPNLLIADWDAEDHTKLLTPDGIHYTNDGYRVRAAFTLQALEAVTRCTDPTHN